MPDSSLTLPKVGVFPPIVQRHISPGLQVLFHYPQGPCLGCSGTLVPDQRPSPVNTVESNTLGRPGTCGRIRARKRGWLMTDNRPGDPEIRVFLLDDHELVRIGVRDLLEAQPDIRVIGEAGTAASAVARIPALRPDVAILDVRLPDGDGISVCREIRSRMPEVACLMLTSFGDDEALFDAVMAGAAGYVLKQIRGTDLLGAVRTVASGQSMLDPKAASQLMARLRDASARQDPLAGLSAQERKILELIGEGLTNRQIGERMFLAEKTVKNYVSALFAKLGMERRTQAAAYAVRVFGDQHDGDP